MQALLTMPSDHHESSGSGYGNNNMWMGMGAYSQAGHQPTMSPIPDYQGFDYSQHPAPLEPAYSMPRPPPYANNTPQLPPPLIMPQNVWPSMLATSQSNYQTPILPAAPIQTPISAGTGSDVTPTSAKPTTSRRKLTDDERRQMCLEAEQNPTMKQTQIGAKFNVERSTVSKILRQREKYMNPAPKEEIPSPGKKTKAKMPDFEKTLANWVKNQQRKGLPITDDELRKQARVFSFSRSDQALLSSATWLEKFKHKNHLLSGSKAGTPGMTDESGEGNIDDFAGIDQSPLSSDGLVSPPMSAEDDVKLKADAFFDFDTKLSYEDSPLLESGMDPSLQSSVLSPLSPEVSRSDRMNLQQNGEAYSRQRSQTSPHLNDFNTGLHNGSTVAPSLPVRSISTADSRSIAIDPRQMMKRHKSVPDIHDTGPVRFSSMQPPPLPRSADVSPVSNPVSPAEDDNIKALHAIKKLLQQHPNVAEPDDYLAIGKLMEKLKLLRSPTLSAVLPGGMHPMDILDSPRISKKRTILGIST